MTLFLYLIGTSLKVSEISNALRKEEKIVENSGYPSPHLLAPPGNGKEELGKFCQLLSLWKKTGTKHSLLVSVCRPPVSLPVLSAQMTSHAVFLYQDNCTLNTAVALAAIRKRLLTGAADKGRRCFFSSVVEQHTVNPKGISRGHVRLEMPSGRMAPGNTCCHPGSGCSNGP